jgi:hypothetical protein
MMGIETIDKIRRRRLLQENSMSAIARDMHMRDLDDLLDAAELKVP